MREIFPGVYRVGKNIATETTIPTPVYDEKIIRKRGRMLRIWNPKKSKLAAAILKGLRNFPIKKSSKILYLGIANGTTSSHISDIIGNKGIIYGVEVSPRSIIDLVKVIEDGRHNIVPILEDAHYPERYGSIVEKVDILYGDIAQPDQTDIMLKHADIYLKDKGYMMMAIKARSIAVNKSPKQIFREEITKIERKMEVIERIPLHPYERDHMFVLARK